MDLSGYALTTLHRDSDFALCRARATQSPSRHPTSLLVSVLASDHPRPECLRMLESELALRTELDSGFAVRPLALAQYQGRPALILEDQQGEPLDRLLDAAPVLGAPGADPSAERVVDVRLFLKLAVDLAGTLAEVHRRGIIHKNVKPANVLANAATGETWLTGFGIASRLPRERQVPRPPEAIAGTLAYMAPEQTGRMNRSIDARSDLYSLGVTLYEVLTGSLPFTATDPMDWVHCHIARQAVPPSDRIKHVPPPVSAIIMKLLAKTAEERYQTAAGLQHDLRRCLAQFDAEGCIDDFVLGQSDIPDRLLIPEKLYGRTREIEILLAAFDRVAKTGALEIVMVSGYSGIGKSSVVNELHKVLVPPRGVFAAGKFDQCKRDVPFGTLSQAFRAIVRSLLVKSEAEIRQWREGFREALGPNAQLVVDLVPELKLIIGEQCPVPELPPRDAERRYKSVLRRFLALFAQPEHPLALFLDDLQWLDSATLELLEDMLTHADVRHLLLIGAYRDNEVTSSHPLMQSLQRIRSAGKPVQDIVLTPLKREHVSELIADSLCSDRERAAALSVLVQDKTAGNPFFVIQFLSALVEEGLLTFDHAVARWSWDLAGIHARKFTENVVDIVVGNLGRLPVDTQKALQQLACFGSSTDIASLALVHGDSLERLRRDLHEALRTGLVLQLEDSYRFVHDRVQEAAYSTIPAPSRARTHLRIGRILASRTASEGREEAIFEIVDQLNRAAALISSVREKEELAEFNLTAGKRARASAAYASALRYFVAGISVLSDDGWALRPELMFELELHRAECEFLTGEREAAEARLATLSSRAATTIDQAKVACLRIELFASLGRSDRAMDVGLDYLRDLGFEWSREPTEDDVRREYERMWSLIGGRSIEDLVDLPLMSDPLSLATADVLTKLAPPVFHAGNRNLFCLVICCMVNLSLERGNTDGSCIGYVALGSFVAPQFGDYDAGFQFGRLGCDLVEQQGLQRFKARVLLIFGSSVEPWTNHVRTSRDSIRRAFDIANAIGDLSFATYSRNNLITNLLAAGDPLHEVQREAEQCLDFAEKIRFGHVIDIIGAQLGLVRTLRGLAPTFGCFNEDGFDELEVERRLSGDPMSVRAECWYWIRKLQARFFAGDYVTAVAASLAAQRTLRVWLGYFEAAEALFYGALSHAASCDAAAPVQYKAHVEALTSHHTQLVKWAEHCPDNFADRAALVGAEIARIEGRELDAERLYEGAIRSSAANGFVHNEALAYELAARFYSARGLEAIAQAFLRNARQSYLRWGADGKVRDLDRRHAWLRTGAIAAATGTLAGSVEQLDLATVITVSQTVSGEMVLEKLIDTLMRAAIAYAGAERAVLTLSQGAMQHVAAEATTRDDALIVHLRDEPVSGHPLPETVLRYVLRARESVILDDAATPNPFSGDPYFGRQKTRSVLCLPLTNQAKLIGALYLENNLAPHVFAPSRTAVLKLLASQAAISLENSRLYRDLAEREGRIRRLVDANIIGIFIWQVDGRILEANEAFLTMVGYTRADLVTPGLRWTDLTPPEWRERDERLVPELKRSGILQPFEKEYFRKDGTRVPVLIGVATMGEAGNEGVAFVIDLTQPKRAQEALNRAGAELAHMSRVTTLSALTASIAHEIDQPLSGILTNAATCLLMLDATPPNIEGARETARRTIRDGNRASGVIERLRALFSKREFTLESLDLNETAREVIALVSNDLHRNRVVFQAVFAFDLPAVVGDRVQLQQVVMNLIRNAADAMSDVHDRQRQLLIKTEREGTERVRLSVRDAGIGVSPNDLESLFDAFYTTKSGGMGIGLFVSHSIIERHRGRLWAEPNHDGPGATFAFSIPQRAQNLAPKDTSSSFFERSFGS